MDLSIKADPACGGESPDPESMSGASSTRSAAHATVISVHSPALLNSDSLRVAVAAGVAAAAARQRAYNDRSASGSSTPNTTPCDDPRVIANVLGYSWTETYGEQTPRTQRNRWLENRTFGPVLVSEGGGGASSTVASTPYAEQQYAERFFSGDVWGQRPAVIHRGNATAVGGAAVSPPSTTLGSSQSMYSGRPPSASSAGFSEAPVVAMPNRVRRVYGIQPLVALPSAMNVPRLAATPTVAVASASSSLAVVPIPLTPLKDRYGPSPQRGRASSAAKPLFQSVGITPTRPLRQPAAEDGDRPRVGQSLALDLYMAEKSTTLFASRPVPKQAWRQPQQLLVRRKATPPPPPPPPSAAATQQPTVGLALPVHEGKENSTPAPGRRSADSSSTKASRPSTAGLVPLVGRGAGGVGGNRVTGSGSPNCCSLSSGGSLSASVHPGYRRVQGRQLRPVFDDDDEDSADHFT